MYASDVMHKRSRLLGCCLSAVEEFSLIVRKKNKSTAVPGHFLYSDCFLIDSDMLWMHLMHLATNSALRKGRIAARMQIRIDIFPVILCYKGRYYYEEKTLVFLSGRPRATVSIAKHCPSIC